jgi:hypothetical protein
MQNSSFLGLKCPFAELYRKLLLMAGGMLLKGIAVGEVFSQPRSFLTLKLITYAILRAGMY